MAMSAGTIFCMSGDELIMDEAAFIGPIDPQVPSRNGMYVPAQSLMTLIDEIYLAVLQSIPSPFTTFLVDMKGIPMPSST